MQQVQFAKYVGVAPSTTTMTLGQASPAMAAAQLAAARAPKPQYMPYTSMADMRGGLGMVFPASGGGYMQTGAVGRVYDQNGNPQPWATQAPTDPLSMKWTTSVNAPLPPKAGYGSVQISGSATGSGSALGFISRDWWQTGRTRGDSTQGGYNYPTNVQPLSGLGFTPGPERGYVNRTLIGAGLGEAGAQAVFIESPNAPNDAELSRVYQYMPVHAGWKYVNASQGVAGLGATDASVAAVAASAVDAATAQKIADTQTRQHHLQIVATLAMATMAIVGVATYMRSK
jgi:hypothetical protein